MEELSIYIHIPFCVRKCLYCDFLSFPLSAGRFGNTLSDSADARMMSYVNFLREEIIGAAPQYREYQVLSVFFGGGTPSLLPDGEVRRIMDTIRKYYRVAEDAEITIEMNPETVTEEKLQEYITGGINRLSIGLQSADDDELMRIGRIHDYSTFEKAYELSRKAGFHNINIDLMAALPEQSVDSYEWTLKKVTSLAPEHISAYSLTLEEGTPLYEHRDMYRFATEEEDRDMYALTEKILGSCGYHRYEISNYALDGYECRHNEVYWQRGNYVGFGLGASSMVNNIRWSNPADMELYSAYVERFAQDANRDDGHTASERDAGGHMTNRQLLTMHEQMEEYMFLGLRMMCGVSMRKFAEIFGTSIETIYGEVTDKLCAQGLLVQEDGYIRLTARGIDISNYVMAQFLFDETDR